MSRGEIEKKEEKHKCKEKKRKGGRDCQKSLDRGEGLYRNEKKYWNEMTQKQIKTIPARQRKNAATWIGRFFSLRIKVL